MELQWKNIVTTVDYSFSPKDSGELQISPLLVFLTKYTLSVKLIFTEEIYKIFLGTLTLQSLPLEPTKAEINFYVTLT